MGVVGDRGLEPLTSTAAGAPALQDRGSTSAVLARGYKARASGEPKARPLTECRKQRAASILHAERQHRLTFPRPEQPDSAGLPFLVH